MPDKTPAHHGRGGTVGEGGNCAADTGVSKQSNVGRDETMAGSSKVLVGHSGARTWGQEEATIASRREYVESAAGYASTSDVGPKRSKTELERNRIKMSVISDNRDGCWEYAQRRRADSSDIESDEWTDSKTECDKVVEKTVDRQSSVVTRQPTGRHDSLLSSVGEAQRYRQSVGTDRKGSRPYQSPEFFSPIWPIDSAYGTVPTTDDASRCPKERQICSTRDLCPTVTDDILDDDEDVVIPPSGVVSSKTVDEDTLTETRSDVSEGEGLATASDFRRPVDRTRLARWEMSRRRDTLGGSRMKQSSAKEQHVLQRSRKEQLCKYMSDIEQSSRSSRNPSIKMKVGLSRETIGRSVERGRYPNILDALRHPSLKTFPRYELCQIDSGDERVRYDHSLDGKMFCVGTSDKEGSVKGKRDQSAHRSGIPSCGRYSPMPTYRQNALIEEKYFTDTPHVDRHSVSIRQPTASVRMGQRSKQGVSIGNKCPDVSYPLLARQKDQTRDEPMSAKVRFSPYVPSVRKSPTDGQNRSSKWEGKRGTSPPVGEYSQDQERRKTSQKASTSQKTSGMQYIRSSSSDSGAEDTDQGARKKSSMSSECSVESIPE